MLTNKHPRLAKSPPPSKVSHLFCRYRNKFSKFLIFIKPQSFYFWLLTPISSEDFDPREHQQEKSWANTGWSRLKLMSELSRSFRVSTSFQDLKALALISNWLHQVRHWSAQLWKSYQLVQPLLNPFSLASFLPSYDCPSHFLSSLTLVFVSLISVLLSLTCHSLSAFSLICFSLFQPFNSPSSYFSIFLSFSSASLFPSCFLFLPFCPLPISPFSTSPGCSY